MENLPPPETLTIDPPATKSSDLAEETLAQTENNAVIGAFFAPGDFVWAKVKGPLWWPAIVSPEMKNESVLVSYFGDCDTLAWCEPKQLKPFLKVFDEMSRQSSSNSFLRALESCEREIERVLEMEMTCHCVPVEARPMGEGGGKGIAVPVANVSAGEFMDWIVDAARDVSVVSSLEIVQLKSLVCCFGKVLAEGESWEFRRRRGIEDLVDKIDLDALPVEIGSGKEEEEEGLGVGVSKRRRRRRSIMPKPVGKVDFDALKVEVDEEGQEEVVERSLRSKKRKCREKLEVVKVEEDVFSSSGRRERKKSKYLSPPYTNMREVGKFLATLPKNSEEKSPRKAACFPDHGAEEGDSTSYLLKIERMPVLELFSEFVAAAENPFHLKGHRAAKVIKHFFAVYRKYEYSRGDDLEELKKLFPECIAKTEDDVENAVENAGKSERNGRNNKHGGYKETGLDFKRRKSNSKRGADQETTLDSKGRSPKNETFLGNDLNSKQKESYSLDKQISRRKKISKNGEAEQKTRNNKNGTSQGASVVSDNYVTNALDEGKEKPNPRRKRKKLNDGISKGWSRKRCKNDANGEEAVNVELQIVSSFHEIDSEKKKRVCKDAAIKSQTPVLMNRKKIGSKEDANGKSFQNSSVRKIKLPEGGKSGPKKKGGNGPPKAKRARRKAKNVDPIYGRQAALQLTFHSGVALPSIEDLITSYSKYGALIDTGVELFEESNSARVMFVKAADAENAFKDKAGPYGSVATYRLHYLPENLTQPNHELVSSTSLQISEVTSPSQHSPDPKSAVIKPPLPYIRKSLETMISTLALSSSPVNVAGSSSDGLKPEARDNLVGEMQGLLQKVEKMLNGPGTSSST